MKVIQYNENYFFFVRHFAIVCSTKDVGQQTYITRVRNCLPATLVYMSQLKPFAVSI